MRKNLLLLTLAIAAPSAFAQVPLLCVTTASPLPVRAEGETELAGDLLINCTGGTPTAPGNPVPMANLQVFTSPAINITSRLLAPGFSEALLVVNDPAPASQLMCGTPTGICPVTASGSVYDGTPGHHNVFQARQAGANSVVFLGVPIDPPGPARTLTFRITNLRLNVRQLGLVPVGPPLPVAAIIAVQNPVAGMQINNPMQQIAMSLNGLKFSLATEQTFTRCVPENPALAANPAATGVSQFKLVFEENFPTAFTRRTAAPYVDTETSPAPADQNVPGTVYLTESGFLNLSFPTVAGRGNLARAGLADHGTRLHAKFTSVPANVKLFADAVVPLKNGANVTGVMRMVSVNPDGSGPFAPTPANSFGIAPIPVDGSGNATVVYEVLYSGIQLELAEAPVYVAYGASPAAGTGAAMVTGALAPLNNVGVASETDPIPRFDNGTPAPAFRINGCGNQRMTGGGSVFTASGTRVTHGFELHCDIAATPNNLEINWPTGQKFHLTALTSAQCLDDPAINAEPPSAPFDTYIGKGTGKLNGVAGATAEWTFTDAGEPGTKDNATIVVKDPGGAVVLTVSGKLDKGNQQAHK